jgi:Na+/melibiose symporter-like transporter
VLSIVGLTVLLYAIIEAPQKGWTSSSTVAGFAAGVIVLGAFLLWEAHTDHPMLDVTFFKNPRFTAASMGIMMVFFAMFGATFLLTQYFQFVLGYTPLETGIRFLPIAASMMILSPLSARFVHRIGTKLVVGTGLLMVTGGLISWASLSATSSYWPDIIWRQALLASGMALTMAPATESIMGSLPLAKAGVGSAVNDTTRQVGGALGVAVIGSVLASIYGAQVGDFLKGKPVPSGTAETMQQSLGIALAAGQRIPGLAETATNAFMDGMHAGVLVAAGVALVGAVIAFVWLPARAGYDALAEPGVAEADPAEAGPEAEVVSAEA